MGQKMGKALAWTVGLAVVVMTIMMVTAVALDMHDEAIRRAKQPMVDKWKAEAAIRDAENDAKKKVATENQPANPNSIGELMKDPDKAYVIQTDFNVRTIGQNMDGLASLIAKPDYANETWRMQMEFQLQQIRGSANYDGRYTMYSSVTATKLFEAIDADMVKGRQQMADGAKRAVVALTMANGTALTESLKAINEGSLVVADARQQIKEVAQTNRLGVEMR